MSKRDRQRLDWARDNVRIERLESGGMLEIRYSLWIDRLPDVGRSLGLRQIIDAAMRLEVPRE